MSNLNYVSLSDSRSFLSHAFLRDGDTEHTGQALYLAMLLHCSGDGRTEKNEREIAALLDDPNITPPKRG